MPATGAAGVTNESAESLRWMPRPWLALGVLLFAGAMLAAGWTSRYAHDRLAALDHVRRIDGEVILAPLPAWWPTAIRVPRWLRRIDTVRIFKGDAEDLRRLEPLHELKVLWFSGRNLTDDCMPSIAKFRHLTTLAAIASSSRCGPHTKYVSERSVLTDAGLQSLAGLPLESLLVASPRITDAGLRPLADLPLRELDLKDSRVTDAGLHHLSRMPLDKLSLEGTRVGDAGLKALTSVPLTELNLCCTRVSDAGLTELAKIPLETVDLTVTRITPGGLLTLKTMKTLRRIECDPLTPSDEAQLKAAGLPIVRE